MITVDICVNEQLCEDLFCTSLGGQKLYTGDGLVSFGVDLDSVY